MFEWYEEEEESSRRHFCFTPEASCQSFCLCHLLLRLECRLVSDHLVPQTTRKMIHISMLCLKQSGMGGSNSSSSSTGTGSQGYSSSSASLGGNGGGGGTNASPSGSSSTTGVATTGSSSGGGSTSNSEQLSRTNLYIRGLTPNTTDKDLEELCRK